MRVSWTRCVHVASTVKLRLAQFPWREWFRLRRPVKSKLLGDLVYLAFDPHQTLQVDAAPGDGLAAQAFRYQPELRQPVDLLLVKSIASFWQGRQEGGLDFVQPSVAHTLSSSDYCGQCGCPLPQKMLMTQ